MIKKQTRQKLIIDRFAYEPNEEVLVNAIELCNELIDFDRLKAKHEKLVRDYELLAILLEVKECDKKEYRRFSLTA